MGTALFREISHSFDISKWSRFPSSFTRFNGSGLLRNGDSRLLDWFFGGGVQGNQFLSFLDILRNQLQGSIFRNPVIVLG